MNKLYAGGLIEFLNVLANQIFESTAGCQGHFRRPILAQWRPKIQKVLSRLKSDAQWDCEFNKI